MNASDYAAKLKLEMASIQRDLVVPGVNTFEKYRELVSRYQTLMWAHEQLKISTSEEDKE